MLDAIQTKGITGSPGNLNITEVATTLLREVKDEHERDLSMQAEDPLKFPVNPDTDLLKALYRDADFLLRARTARVEENWEELETVFIEFSDVLTDTPLPSSGTQRKRTPRKGVRTSLLISRDKPRYVTSASLFASTDFGH